MLKKKGSHQSRIKQSNLRANINQAVYYLERRHSTRIRTVRQKYYENSLAHRYAIFLRELINNPRGMGAACPSSKGLAKTMASFIPNDDDSYIVELGAGTGVVTRAILDRGINPSRLIVVEISEKLVKVLRKQFPQVRIVHGDAAALGDHLKSAIGIEDLSRVSTIVSSLPLRSLPSTLVHAIKQQITEVIPQDGQLIQFTYALRPVVPIYSTTSQLRKVQSKIRWLNLPPARVEVYSKKLHG